MKELYDIVEKSLKEEETAIETYCSLAVTLFLDDPEELLSSRNRIDNLDDYTIYLAQECDKQEIDRYMHKIHTKYPVCRECAIKEVANARYAVRETKSPGISWWTFLPTKLMDNTEEKYGAMIREKLAQFKDDILIERIYSSWTNDHINRGKGYDNEVVIIDLYCNNDATMTKLKDFLEKEFGGFSNNLY